MTQILRGNMPGDNGAGDNGASKVLGIDAKVLGIDTSQVVCVGLARGLEVLASESVNDTQAHAEELMPLVQNLLQGQGLTVRDLDAIAVGVGPGPFTGLRVGVVTALTLAEILRVPVRGVCSLDTIAVAAVSTGEIATRLGRGDFLVACDARRKELYWAQYDSSGRRLSGPMVTSPGALPTLPTCGPGTRVHPVPGPVISGLDVLDAGILARAAWKLPDAGLEPLYLRRPDAEVSTKVKSSLPASRIVMGAMGRRQ